MSAQSEATTRLKREAEQQIRELFELQRGKKIGFAAKVLLDQDRCTPQNVFATTREINIARMQAIGFDYDYTLANYTDEIYPLIYNLAKEYLVNELRYPSEFASYASYDPDFPIRGLYYDTRKGNLLKLDYLNNIQYDAVYHGKTQLSKMEVAEAYGSFHVSVDYVKHLRPMFDNFSLPEICLVADTIQFFADNEINFYPPSVYQDVNRAIQHIHVSLKLHNRILEDLPRYLRGSRPALRNYLEKLRRKKQDLFVVTNSPFHFIDPGMKVMLGDDWRSLFTSIIVSANKPNWFLSEGTPFRQFDTDTGATLFHKVDKLESDKIYVGGCMEKFNANFKYPGDKVLYLGDHIFSDLREPSRTQGWRTGAIVSELGMEIKLQSDPSYQRNLSEMLQLQDLRRKLDMLAKNKDKTVLFELGDRIIHLAKELKTPFNRYFGSEFRTAMGPTAFGYLCQRYADLYTSKVENLGLYPWDYRFSATRNSLPHEPELDKQDVRVSIDLGFDKAPVPQDVELAGVEEDLEE